MPLAALPQVPHDAFSRDFIIDNNRVEVTSVDVAPHGGFFVAGCSNGVILMFDMSDNSSQRNGILLAQIRPKGMHTTLRLTVKISDDSAICFAGVIKGSSEMIAVDMSSFQLNWNNFVPPVRGRKPLQLQDHVDKFYSSTYEVYSYSDAKLRGFGAATSLPMTESSISEAGTTRRYLLACGMGIKNVHVWQLTLLEPTNPLDENQLPIKRDEWKCIYDVACNGMTITHLGFRNEGKELLTKSAGVNIRVWDLSRYSEDPVSKPMYEDISNSHDVKCLLENSAFTYGGLYEFAVVKVDKNTPKEANRNVFELPVNTSNALEEDSGLRRRRTMREVQDIMGTQDGVHVMVLCTDGGIMHYKRPHSYPEHMKSSDEDSDAESTPSSNVEEDLGKIFEVPYPRKETDVDQAWCLRRVGGQGVVILVHAYFRADKETQTSTGTNQNNGNIPPPMANVIMQKNGVVMVSVKVLTDLLPRDFSFHESSSLSTTSAVSKWHASGLFYQRHAAASAAASAAVMTNEEGDDEVVMHGCGGDKEPREPSTPRNDSRKGALHTPSPAGGNGALGLFEQPKAPHADRSSIADPTTMTTGIAMMFGSDSPTSAASPSNATTGSHMSNHHPPSLGLPPAAPTGGNGTNSGNKKRKLAAQQGSDGSATIPSAAGLATPTTSHNSSTTGGRKSTPKLSPVEESSKYTTGVAAASHDTPVRQTSRTSIPNTRYEQSAISTPTAATTTSASTVVASNTENGKQQLQSSSQARAPMTMLYDPYPLVIPPPPRVRRVVPTNRVLPLRSSITTTTEEMDMEVMKADQERMSWAMAPFTLLWDSFQHALTHYPFPTAPTTLVDDCLSLKTLQSQHLQEQTQLKGQFLQQVKQHYDAVIVPQLQTFVKTSSSLSSSSLSLSLNLQKTFSKACFHKIRKEYQKEIIPLVLARQQSEWQSALAKEYFQQSLTSSLSSSCSSSCSSQTSHESEEESEEEEDKIMKEKKPTGYAGYLLSTAAVSAGNEIKNVKFVYEDVFLLIEQLEGRLYEQVTTSSTSVVAPTLMTV